MVLANGRGRLRDLVGALEVVCGAGKGMPSNLDDDGRTVDAGGWDEGVAPRQASSVAALVVGHPLDLMGREQATGQRMRSFLQQIYAMSDRLPPLLCFWDERFSTRAVYGMNPESVARHVCECAAWGSLAWRTRCVHVSWRRLTRFDASVFPN